ncbi:protein distal antenna-like [Agrilus planipennis]|uniref:Protein distal antenna-like n=1 Tax=Agrilus planipennis TaxID=224129 RepID=A0A1W4XJ17_AGRPL|nr:protein distal antenna-like [Agrilus planipennis]
MSTKTTGKRPLRTLSAHEKLDAIRRVHDGESKASVARDIGVPESTLRGWCKNEDKISYLSRQSTPENDETSPLSEPKEKRSKADDQPYNLSVKVSTKINSSFSSNGSTKNTTTVSDSIVNAKPFNLSQKDGLKTTTQMSERERNRAELARLSVELGLNRPEMFLNMNGTSSLTELTAGMSLLAQWNSLLQKNQTGKITAAADSSNSVVSSTDILAASTPVKIQQKSSKLPKIDKTPSSVDESVWYWLKNSPSLLGITPTSDVNSTASTGSVGINTSTTYSTSTPMSFAATPTPLPASMPPTFETTDHHSSWFWKWYKQFASVYSQTAANQIPDKPILYQQLTKDKDGSNSENLHLSDEKPMKNNTKVRAVLDSLLLNNNNVALRKQESVSDEPQTPIEALEHGEKFLKWLENCGDPSVTAMQIMQFRYLINNIKNNVEKRNGDTLHKNKVRRK